MVRDDMKCVCDEFLLLLCEMREIFSLKKTTLTLYKQTRH
jgi:hypothetical protein